MRGTCADAQGVGRVIETLQSGSVAQVEVPMNRERIPLQGSGGPFVCPGGAGRVATTKGLTGIDSPFVRCAGAGVFRIGPLARWLTWSHATGAGALTACGDVLTAIADVRLAHAG